MGGNGLLDVAFGLLAEPMEVANAPSPGGAQHLLGRLHVEVVPKHLHALRSEPGHLEQLGDRRGHFLAQASQHVAAACRRELRDLAGEVGADARVAGERFAALGHLLHVAREFLDGARGVAIGADAKRVGALDLEAVGDFVEEGGDDEILNGHLVRSGWRCSVRSCNGDPSTGSKGDGQENARSSSRTNSGNRSFGRWLMPAAPTRPPPVGNFRQRASAPVALTSGVRTLTV